MPAEMSKVYDPSQIEQKWYKIWEENHLFTPEENSSKESFTIVIPPPNVTGNLHMGHALDNSIQDILIRYKKLQGFNTLWLPGTDHAGIATQNVVVKALKAEGITKEQLGREGFIKRVWKWKEEYGGNITRQLRRLGCALDWTRERFTMDEGLSRAVTHEFVTLYNKGLIYRGKRLVNWCPKCGTAISDIEVEHESKKGKLWYIRYCIEKIKDQKSNSKTIPKSEISKDDYIVVATTRPETMLGDTAVAVNPNDERYKHLIGKMLVLPLVNRLIPVIKDEYVDATFGTGAVKVTPAHDLNDFEMGERHGLPRINILNTEGKLVFTELSEKEKTDITDLEGVDRFKARERIVERLEQGGFIEKIEDYENAVGECYRCKSIIEPYLSDQWYVKVKDLAREAIRVVEEGKIKFVPERWTKIYINWMVNLKDWCISRQLWWGHRIPAWYCRGMSNVKCQMSNECNEVIVSEIKPEKCPKCGGTHLEQDPDVFDTWFSSALWPFSTLGWPEKTKDLATFYPTDVLVTGYDIITFWVSRMIMTGMYFMPAEPFHAVFIHGLVRDAQGKKMSKSFGNVIDPLGIIDEVGADALRFALVSLITGQGQDIKLTKEKITEARNFCNKIWNASRFTRMSNNKFQLSKQASKPNLEYLNDFSIADRWIVSRYNQTIKKATSQLENYEFGDAARSLYDFIWGEFCDWYLEISKIDLYSDDEEKKKKVAGVLHYILEGTLRLLHPFMPFITEEIWGKLMTNDEMGGITEKSSNIKDQISKQDANQKSKTNSIMLAEWPKVSEGEINIEAEMTMRLLMELVTSIRNVKAEMSVQTKEVDLIFVAAKKAEREILQNGIRLIKFLTKAAKVEIVESLAKKPEQSASGIVGEIQFFVPLKGLIDIGREVERLKKEIGKIDSEMDRLKGLLAKEDFVAKAPPETIAKQKEKIVELEEKKKLLSARVKDLS